MNISSGMSVIHTPYASKEPQGARIYLWPTYNTGKIVKTAPVSREKQPEFIYKKPEPEEFNRIMSLTRQKPAYEYTEKGIMTYSKPVIQRGSLFEAIV